MVEIYAIKLPGEKRFQELRERMLSLIDEKRRERIMRFKFYEDAQRSLLGDIMVRSIISKKLNINNKQIIFKISAKGKPFIAGHPDLCFNISHARNWVVSAFSDHEVGIDVEIVKKINYNVAEIFFSKEENLSLNKLSGQKKLEYFFDLWTMKESYLKYTGKGLSEPLNSFTVRNSDNNFTILHPASRERVFLKQYEIDKAYKLAVCSATRNFDKQINQLYIEKCLEQTIY